MIFSKINSEISCISTLFGKKLAFQVIQQKSYRLDNICKTACCSKRGVIFWIFCLIYVRRKFLTILSIFLTFFKLETQNHKYEINYLNKKNRARSFFGHFFCQMIYNTNKKFEINSKTVLENIFQSFLNTRKPVFSLQNDHCEFYSR